MLVKSIWGPTVVKEGCKDRWLLLYLKASVHGIYTMEKVHTVLNLATN